MGKSTSDIEYRASNYAPEHILGLVREGKIRELYILFDAIHHQRIQTRLNALDAHIVQTKTTIQNYSINLLQTINAIEHRGFLSQLAARYANTLLGIEESNIYDILRAKKTYTKFNPTLHCQSREPYIKAVILYIRYQKGSYFFELTVLEEILNSKPDEESRKNFVAFYQYLASLFTRPRYVTFFNFCFDLLKEKDSAKYEQIRSSYFKLNPIQEEGDDKEEGDDEEDNKDGPPTTEKDMSRLPFRATLPCPAALPPRPALPAFAYGGAYHARQLLPQYRGAACSLPAALPAAKRPCYSQPGPPHLPAFMPAAQWASPTPPPVFVAAHLLKILGDILKYVSHYHEQIKTISAQIPHYFTSEKLCRDMISALCHPREGNSSSEDRAELIKREKAFFFAQKQLSCVLCNINSRLKGILDTSLFHELTLQELATIEIIKSLEAQLEPSHSALSAPDQALSTPQAQQTQRSYDRFIQCLDAFTGAMRDMQTQTDRILRNITMFFRYHEQYSSELQPYQTHPLPSRTNIVAIQRVYTTALQEILASSKTVDTSKILTDAELGKALRDLTDAEREIQQRIDTLAQQNNADRPYEHPASSQPPQGHLAGGSHRPLGLFHQPPAAAAAATRQEVQLTSGATNTPTEEESRAIAPS